MRVCGIIKRFCSSAFCYTPLITAVGVVLYIRQWILSYQNSLVPEMEPQTPYFGRDPRIYFEHAPEDDTPHAYACDNSGNVRHDSSKVYKPLDPIVAPSDVTEWDKSGTFLVYVYSAPDNFNQRQLIRHTWGNSSYYDKSDPFRIHVIFVVGVSLDDSHVDISSRTRRVVQEHCSHGDMLVLNFRESYYNLTLKGLAAMTWLTRHVNAVDVILKTDDDVLLNTFSWFNEAVLMRNNSCTTCIRCRVFSYATPHRSGKWGVSYMEYPNPVYPPFCSGTGYLMTRDAMSAIVKRAAYDDLFKLEDVYFTGIVAEKAGVTRLDVVGQYRLWADEEFSPLENFRLVTSDALPASEWEYFWNNVSSHKQLHGDAERVLWAEQKDSPYTYDNLETIDFMEY